MYPVFNNTAAFDFCPFPNSCLCESFYKSGHPKVPCVRSCKQTTATFLVLCDDWAFWKILEIDHGATLFEKSYFELAVLKHRGIVLPIPTCLLSLHPSFQLLSQSLQFVLTQHNPVSIEFEMTSSLSEISTATHTISQTSQCIINKHQGYYPVHS